MEARKQRGGKTQFSPILYFILQTNLLFSCHLHQQLIVQIINLFLFTHSFCLAACENFCFYVISTCTE